MSRSFDILVAESRDFSPAAAQRIQAAGRVRFADLDYAGLLGAVGGAHVLWVRLRHFLGAEVFEAAPRLQVVVTATTGLNHIDLAEAERRGVRVLSLKGEADFLREIRATAELTIGLMLSVYRRIPAASRHALTERWDRDAFRGRELYGKTVGLVGYGRLGRIVGRYLVALGARVLATDPLADQMEFEAGVEAVSLERLLAGSDIVSLHASYDKGNRRFFNRDCFERMQPGAVFVNTARGELVDEAALLAALRAGRLSAAALDVLDGEQALDVATHPLVRYAAENANLLITPHIGGSTVESLAKVEEYMAERLMEFLAETQPASPELAGAVSPRG